jgi:heme A synthase
MHHTTPLSVIILALVLIVSRKELQRRGVTDRQYGMLWGLVAIVAVTSLVLILREGSAG